MKPIKSIEFLYRTYYNETLTSTSINPCKFNPTIITDNQSELNNNDYGGCSPHCFTIGYRECHWNVAAFLSQFLQSIPLVDLVAYFPQ